MSNTDKIKEATATVKKAQALLEQQRDDYAHLLLYLCEVGKFIKEDATIAEKFSKDCLYNLYGEMTAEEYFGKFEDGFKKLQKQFPKYKDSAFFAG